MEMILLRGGAWKHPTPPPWKLVFIRVWTGEEGSQRGRGWAQTTADMAQSPPRTRLAKCGSNT